MSCKKCEDARLLNKKAIEIRKSNLKCCDKGFLPKIDTRTMEVRCIFCDKLIWKK